MEILNKNDDSRVSVTDWSEMRNLHSAISHDFWKSHQKQILRIADDSLSLGNDSRATSHKFSKEIGEVFADLRSLSVSLVETTPPNDLTNANIDTGNTTSPNSPDSTQNDNEENQKDNNPHIFELPGWLNVRRKISAKINLGGTFCEKNGEAQNIFDTFWPFLSGELQSTGSSSEFAVSTFLRSRVLYCSSLGYQPALDEPQSPTPVFYVTISKNGDKWQNGRLIDRINTLGILRLAAMWELGKIITASDTIKKLENDLDYLTWLIESRAKQEASIATAIRKEYADIQEADKQLQESFDKLLDLSKQFEGGLSYRVERSRYYQKQYEESLGHLNCERVEGFQPYSEFVKRRLYSTYNFIDMVGKRYEDLQNKMARLSRTRQSRQIEHLGKTLVALQEASEVVFYIGIVPYYLGNLLEKISYYAIRNTDNFENVEKSDLTWITIVTFAICSSIWLRKKTKRKSNREQIDS